MKRIAVIGSTGFIGRQALQIVEKYPDRFQVAALTAFSSADLLISQAKKFKPYYVGICSPEHYGKVAGELSCTVECGEACLRHVAQTDCDIVLVAVVGCAGLSSVLAAIDSGKQVALANKESLVSAGQLVMSKAKEHGVTIIPVDSEHSAIWQCLGSGFGNTPKRLILTASGGPFYDSTAEALKEVTPEVAIKHPTWNMGKKISVDSATMMNKGLEIIEARWLFDTQKIDYIIHRQSIIHSMVEFEDGAVIAQMSYPDMRLPIQLAFTYPERIPVDMPPMPFGTMTFMPPREDLFPLPSVAKKSLAMGGIAPCVLNAANESAVALFLDGKISFTDISEIVQKTLYSWAICDYSSEDEILAVHREVYDKLMTDYKNILRS